MCVERGLDNVVCRIGGSKRVVARGAGGGWRWAGGGLEVGWGWAGGLTVRTGLLLMLRHNGSLPEEVLQAGAVTTQRVIRGHEPGREEREEAEETHGDRYQS